MAGKLTKAQEAALNALGCYGHAGAYQTQLRGHYGVSPSTMDRLRRAGLVEAENVFGKVAWFLTDAGRQALSLKPEDGR